MKLKNMYLAKVEEECYTLYLSIKICILLPPTHGSSSRFGLNQADGFYLFKLA